MKKANPYCEGSLADCWASRDGALIGERGVDRQAV